MRCGGLALCGALLPALLAGCNLAADPTEAAVAEVLVDPTRPRFRSVAEGVGGITCGEVSARTPAGGYGAYQRFIVDRDGAAIVGQGLLADGTSLPPLGRGYPQGGLERLVCCFDVVWEKACLR